MLEWSWRGETIRLSTNSSGAGLRLLLLPALSSISTRHEMRPLQERLARRYSCLCVDWPGFGDGARPQVDWTPEAYSAFLSFLLASVIPQPHAVIAAGHAATYALEHACSAPQAMARLVLLAPTWRGPLPTMAGGHRPLFDRLCRLVDRPGLGPLIYRLNVNRFVVRRMGAGHVYTDPSFLTAERLRDKLAVVRAPGARFASVRFVTGRLDPLASRDEFLDLARRVATSHPGCLWRRDAAEVARGDGGARGAPRHSQRSACARKARRTRGVSRRHRRGRRAVPARGAGRL